MALTKRTYVDGETVITAQNLNDIQDEIIQRTVSNVSFNSGTRYLQKTLNGTTTNIVSLGNIVEFNIVEVTS